MNFTKAGCYDKEWVQQNMMGPNALYLAEYLADRMELRPGMRVLDLGCGRAMTSIFLAKEYGVTVWATDLWISPSDNYQRIRDMGVEDRVYPVYGEAHALPYADDYFDAIISIDAYDYFGTEDEYLDKHCAGLVKPGGEIGIVITGFSREMDGDIPEGLKPYWEEDFTNFHSAPWWKAHWEKSREIEVMISEKMSNGKQIWYESIWSQGVYGSDRDREMLKADVTDLFTMIMMIGRRREI